MSLYKKCKICEEIKPLDKFYKNKSTSDGYERYCRICVSTKTKKHAEENPLTYAWKNVKSRCDCEKYEYYKYFGGRGITYDETFKTYDIFWKTYKHKYEEAINKYGKDVKLEIDRIDNNGNYEYNNIRFVPRVVNQNNKSSNTHMTFNGETHTLSDWSRKTNISLGKILLRRRQNWPTRLILRDDISKDLSKAITLAIKEIKNANETIQKNQTEEAD